MPPEPIAKYGVQFDMPSVLLMLNALPCVMSISSESGSSATPSLVSSVSSSCADLRMIGMILLAMY